MENSDREVVKLPEEVRRGDEPWGRLGAVETSEDDVEDTQLGCGEALPTCTNGDPGKQTWEIKELP